jgi:hypothetical protein
MEMTIRVGSGSVPLRLENKCLKIGTMKIIIAVMITTTAQSTMDGYAIAERTFWRSSTCFSRVFESLRSTKSSWPPTSPARTIAM